MNPQVRYYVGALFIVTFIIIIADIFILFWLQQSQDSLGGIEWQVHAVSPRPTFAETNAWLLEAAAPTPTTLKKKKNNDDNNNNMDTSMVFNAGSLGRSYSILDNNVQTPSNDDDATMDSAEDEDNNSDKKGGAQRLKRQVTWKVATTFVVNGIYCL